jgi:hypothetical protein
MLGFRPRSTEVGQIAGLREQKRAWNTPCIVPGALWKWYYSNGVPSPKKEEAEVNKFLRVASQAVVTLVFCVGLIGSVRATTMRYLSLDQLYEMSELVVRGTILSHETFWGNDGTMYTDWTLSVDEVLEGETIRIVTFRQMGGELDDLILHIPGDAQLTDGEHVVLFLIEDAGMHYLTAMGQAKLTVSLSGRTGLPGGIVEMGFPDVSPVDALLVRQLDDISFYEVTDAGDRLYMLDDEIITLERLRAMSPSADGGVAQ